jgi:hypothetical protein
MDYRFIFGSISFYWQAIGEKTGTQIPPQAETGKAYSQQTAILSENKI